MLGALAGVGVQRHAEPLQRQADLQMRDDERRGQQLETVDARQRRLLGLGRDEPVVALLAQACRRSTSSDRGQVGAGAGAGVQHVNVGVGEPERAGRARSRSAWSTRATM